MTHEIEKPEINLKKKSDFLETAKRRLDVCQKAESDRRQKQAEVLRFYWGEQWRPDDVTERENNGRPCLTINRTKSFVRQVTNELRLNRPGVLVDPVADTDEETAEIEMGLIRHIAAQSDGEAAIDTAAKHAVIHGEGWFELCCEYVDLDTEEANAQTFNQEIYLREIRNPFSIYDDPNAKLPNREDSKYRFQAIRMTREAFREAYPDAQSIEGISLPQEDSNWLTDDGVLVVKYWYIKEEKRKLCQMVDGSKAWKDELPKEAYDFIETEREWKCPRVKWAILNAVEILDEGDWGGRYFPHVRVVGDQINIEGEEKVAGLVDDLVGPQITYNYWITAATERLAMATKSPWIVPHGMLEGFESEWEQANKKNFAFLYYNPVSVDGQPLPAPTKNDSEPSISGLVAMVHQSDNDMKAVSGIYDASLGARGPEQSGKAIRARQAESDMSNVHFSDNLKQSVKFLGKLLIDLMPKIYDTERVVRIIKPNEEAQMVPINTQPTQENGVKKFFDLTKGQYNVRAQAGKSWATARQELAETMVDLTKSFPPLFQVAGDIMVGAMDFPESRDVAKRLKKLLPPEVQDDEEQSDIPPKIAARLQQLDQYAQQSTQVIEELTKQLESKNDEIASRERMNAENNNTKLLMKIADLDAKMGQILISQEYASAKHEIDISRAEQQQERQHEQGMEAAQIAAQQKAQQQQGSGGI